MFKDMEEILRRNQAFVASGEKLARSNFRELSVLGSGSFAKVYKVSSYTTGKQYAMKILSLIKITNLKLVNQLRKEISTLSKCNHENIIYLYASFEEDNLAFMIQELADGSLFEKMARERRFSEEKVAAYMTDITRAVVYLHSLNPPILHRDLKPENILLLNDRCKLADFGWSSTDDEYRNTYCGTFDYLAPEMIRGTGHNEKLDVWTLGVLMYELLEGKPPFGPKDKTLDKRLMAKMTERNILNGNIEFERGLSKEAVDAIKIIVNVNENLRPSARGVLELDFFKKYRAPPTLPIKTLAQSPSGYALGNVTFSQLNFPPASAPAAVKSPRSQAEVKTVSPKINRYVHLTAPAVASYGSGQVEGLTQEEAAKLRAQVADYRSKVELLTAQNEELKKQLYNRTKQTDFDKSEVLSLRLSQSRLEEEAKSLRLSNQAAGEKIADLSARLEEKERTTALMSKNLGDKTDLVDNSLKLLKDFAETIAAFSRKHHIGSHGLASSSGPIDLFSAKSDLLFILADYEKLRGGNSSHTASFAMREVQPEDAHRVDAKAGYSVASIPVEKLATPRPLVTRWVSQDSLPYSGTNSVSTTYTKSI